MQLNLTELKSNFPPDTLSVLLQRARSQISLDREGFCTALLAGDLKQAAQFIHRVRGLALFLGIPASSLNDQQAAEDRLIALLLTRASIDTHAMSSGFIAFCTSLDELVQSAIGHLVNEQDKSE